IRTVIVSDRPDLVRAACERIESEPRVIVVATAGNGFAGIVAVDVLRPELVLVEVALPGMDGVEATRRIKERPGPPHVVLITPRDSDHVTSAARDAGADAIVSESDLNESVESILKGLVGRP